MGFLLALLILATGIRKPSAILEFEECRYFLTVLPIHPESTKTVSPEVKKIPVEVQTHRYTGVLPTERRPSTGVLPVESLPGDLRYLIQKLCAWHAFTSQQLTEILKRKDKKHLVRKHLTPMVKEGLLKYVYPEDVDSPTQAYMATGD